MVEILSHTDPRSSDKKIIERHNLGYLYELSV